MSNFLTKYKALAAGALSLSAMCSAFAGVSIDVTPINYGKPISSIGIYAQKATGKVLVNKCGAYDGTNVVFKNVPFTKGQVFTITAYSDAACKTKFAQVKQKYLPKTSKYIIVP